MERAILDSSSSKQEYKSKALAKFIEMKQAIKEVRAPIKSARVSGR